ncbi:MAG: hypothetical protein KKH98_05130 [Spirochaetes bacterium]|nr:hypothetical protein [Spirochaetota bacterium]
MAYTSMFPDKGRIKYVISFIFMLLVFLAGNLVALEVDVDELRSAKKVKFYNYYGKHKKMDGPMSIKAIGRYLAENVSEKGDNRQFRYHMKYSIIHAVSEEEKNKLSADIFSIDKDARVDHIRNVRRIIAGYLMNMYDYSEKNAYSLSVFASYYNAIHRSDMDYFSSKYKTTVLYFINKKNAGISTKYYDWPGKTRMLIPLTHQAKRGDLDAIDPDVLSHKSVRDLMREDDENLDVRKDLLEIKEKIITRDKDKVTEEKKALQKDKTLLLKEKESIERSEDILKTREKEALEKEETIRKEKEALGKITDDKKRKQKEEDLIKKEASLQKEREQMQKKKEEVQKERKEYEEKEDKIEKRDKEVQKDEDRIQRKEESLKEEVKEIEEDELKKNSEKIKELIKKEKELDKREDALRDRDVDRNIYARKLFYLKIREYLVDGHYNNTMYMIDAETKKILFKSPVENICGSRYDVFSGGVVVITHAGGHNEKHQLTLLDRDRLKQKAVGSENIFWRSFVQINKGFIYAVIIDDQEFYLGKFDETLNLVARSGEKISKDTFISFYDDFIYINSWDKKILILKKYDLSVIDAIEVSGE